MASTRKSWAGYEPGRGFSRRGVWRSAQCGRGFGGVMADIGKATDRGLRPARGRALAPALGAGRAQTGSRAIRCKQINRALYKLNHFMRGHRSAIQLNSFTRSTLNTSSDARARKSIGSMSCRPSFNSRINACWRLLLVSTIRMKERLKCCFVENRETVFVLAPTADLSVVPAFRVLFKYLKNIWENILCACVGSSA